MLGHIALAMPGGLAMFFVSMVLIVIGTGLLKPNVSSMVGDIYSERMIAVMPGSVFFTWGLTWEASYPRLLSDPDPS